MEQDKKIIAFVDFSFGSEKIVDYAINISEKISKEPHFINIVDVYKDDPMLDNLFVERCEKRLVANAQMRMEDLLEKLSRSNHKCTGEVVCGSQVETVADLTMAHPSDLILISPN